MSALTEQERSEIESLERARLLRLRREEADILAEAHIQASRKARGSTARRVAKAIGYGVLFVIGGFLAIIMIAVVASS